MPKGPLVHYPWNASGLEGWNIVGMNHYFVKGRRCLYVAMMKDGFCIQAEGESDWEVWKSLEEQTERLVGTPYA